MVGTFACPECGAEVYPRGLAAGRQLRCRACSTLVEVPYIPRSGGQARRMNAAKARWKPWAWAGLAVLAGALVMALVVHAMKSQAEAGDRRELAEKIESAERADREGHDGQAIVEFDEILASSKGRAGIPAEILDGVQAKRDALILKRAEARFRSTEADTSPTRALADCLAMLHESDDDRALEPLRPRVRALAAKRAGAELVEARNAAEAGKVDRALDLAARIVAVCPFFPSPDGPQLRDEARGLAGSIISARGVLMEPVTGKFRLGKAEDYANEVRPVLGEALRGRGYQLKPNGSSSFGALWDTSAPYRVSLYIFDEAKLRHFAGTPHVGTRIDARLSLQRGNSEVWSSPISARTRDQPTGITPAEFNRLALSGAPSAEVEQKLYRDARLALHEVIARKLATLPEFVPGLP